MQKFPKVFTLMSTILALAFCLASCKSNVDDDPTVTPQKTAGSISYTTASVSKTTDDAAFTNELTKTGDGTVTYASSKTDVAEVNTKTGLVTIKGAGKTTITATVADSDTYTYATKTASYTLTITQATYIGTKKPTEAKAVGDIVFSDGSATAYSEGLTLTDEEKAAAIAVIFYVGTECSNVSTSRTLGVGLAQNQSGSAWCLDSANACNVNITTIQESDKDGSDNLEQIEAFDGVDDTATEANYPAFYFAKNYASQTGSNVSGTDYADGWYLPAKAELQKIYDILSTVNNALPACGGTTFDTSVFYWSSSQDASSDDRAYFLYFGTGEWGNYRKKYDSRLDTSIYVCAIRAFN